MPLKNSITLDDALVVLNSAVIADSKAMHSLIEHRVDCNEILANHPTIQVGRCQPERYHVGLLGILNGLFGIDETGWGAICAHFHVDCPKGCDRAATDTLSVGDKCPTCGATLVLGELIEFTRATPPK